VEDIITALSRHAELTDVLGDPGIVEQLRTLGNVAKPTTTGEFRARVIAEIETWRKVIAAADIGRF